MMGTQALKCTRVKLPNIVNESVLKGSLCPSVGCNKVSVLRSKFQVFNFTWIEMADRAISSKGHL